jgi:hypothetical protein
MDTGTEGTQYPGLNQVLEKIKNRPQNVQDAVAWAFKMGWHAKRNDGSPSEKILSIIDWYESIPDDFNDIDTLMNKRRMLSVYRTHLSMEYGRYQAKFRRNYGLRKATFFRKKHIGISELDMKIGEAEAMAEDAVHDYRKEESLNQGLADASSSLLKSTDETLSSMNQQISYLKQEKSADMRNSQTH